MIKMNMKNAKAANYMIKTRNSAAASSNIQTMKWYK